MHSLFNINFDAIKPDSEQLSFQCKMCRADFGASKEALENHIVGEICKRRDILFKVNAGGRIECDLCDRFYVGISNLKRHIQLNHSSRKQRNTCEKCNKTYANMSSLKRHVEAIHSSGEKKSVCESCGVEFTRRASLVRHVKLLHKV